MTELAQFAPGAWSPLILANGAPYLARAGTNLEVEYLVYDAATEWSRRTHVIEVPPSYDGEDLSCSIAWSAATATSGSVVWGVSIAVATPNTDASSWEGLSFATERVFAADAAASPALRPFTIAEALTGAQLGSLVAGDLVVFRVARKAGDGGDDMAGNAHLINLAVRF